MKTYILYYNNILQGRIYCNEDNFNNIANLLFDGIHYQNEQTDEYNKITITDYYGNILYEN